MRLVSLACVSASFGLLLAVGCAKVNGLPPGTDGTGGSPPPPSRDAAREASRPDRGPTVLPPACGNGERTSDEACDDGNTNGDDGCAANCLTVDPGYSCTPPGVPCHRIARCGDGVVVLPELCDDRNTTAGDGCSATCKVEIGFKCSGNPSACTPTKCGDRVVEGAESCDDGNTIPFDGCSADCQSEPDCTGSACASHCGDGIVVGEACDDGNNIDGDGCTHDCKIEPGFMCMQPPIGDKMLVPAVYRDFKMHMPMDFEGGQSGEKTAVLGMVKTMLDADGKPDYLGPVNNSHVTSAATFAQWYRDMPSVNHTTYGKLALYNNGKGAFVNRWGPNGEQWVITTKAYYCGNVGREMIDATTGKAIPCTVNDGSITNCTTMEQMGYTQVSCTADNGGSYSAIYQTGLLDGTPTFFPVDKDTFSPASEASTATIPPPYEATGSYPVETGAPKHNFSFTSEVRYWFKFDATKTYTLDFTGDDDVWVFVNKKLAVDLGGVHTAAQGSVTLSAANMNTYGLKDGSVYQAAVFQAERQTTSSTYKLTLSGFSAAPSECRPICGDGILGLGEECDDGKNVGGYGVCGPDCKLGAFCGDGIVQDEQEDCDDGINDGHPCPSGCRDLIIP